MTIVVVVVCCYTCCCSLTVTGTCCLLLLLLLLYDCYDGDRAYDEHCGSMIHYWWYSLLTVIDYDIIVFRLLLTACDRMVCIGSHCCDLFLLIIVVVTTLCIVVVPLPLIVILPLLLCHWRWTLRVITRHMITVVFGDYVMPCRWLTPYPTLMPGRWHCWRLPLWLLYRLRYPFCCRRYRYLTI